MRILFAVSFMLRTVGISAQTLEDPVQKYANTITPGELREHLEVIAGDHFEGRETGTIGLIRAAEYLSGEYRKMGIPPLKTKDGYYQEYPLIEYGWESAVISDEKNRYTFMTDFYGYATSNNSNSFPANEIVFLGYGIDDTAYSDYKNVDVSGKVIIVAYGEPLRNGKSIITGTEEMSDWTNDWRKKVRTATSHKAKCILMIDPDFSSVVTNQQWINFLSGTLLKLKSEYKPSDYCSNFFISQSMAEQLAGKKKKQVRSSIEEIQSDGIPRHFTVSNTVVFEIKKAERVVYADNVFAFVEGSDLKDEIIVVSAHYDHLGRVGDSIYNGADDDGSGTVALLEMAEALMLAKKEGNGPRRSVLFISFSGEEKGLLGSKAYVEDPVFPLTQVVTNLNIDMIGRVDEFHISDTNYIYIIGSDFLSRELHNVNEAAAKTYTDITLDYKYNSTDDPNRFYYRSDHYNFAKNNIPVIFYFSGAHIDYHKPGDDVEKINFVLLTNRTRLIFYTLWLLSNQENRPSLD